MSTVADKFLQAEANYDAEPVDHWILVSPDLDPNNELDRMVEAWNAAQRFPFTVQIWSPQTGVRELFAIEPDIYRSLYGEDPPAPGATRTTSSQNFPSASARHSGCRNSCDGTCRTPVG